jgi:hypothetical protein
MDESAPADGLRELSELPLPDTRMLHLAIREGDTVRPIEQRDRHESIAELALADNVPEQVRTHYDTARNLYLYAWHVYRFHVVAEHQALASLEMALRLALVQQGKIDERGALLGTSGRHTKGKRQSAPFGLARLLSMASQSALISNDRLTRRDLWALRLAGQRRSIEQIEFMTTHQLQELIVPDTPAVPTEDELAHDWLSEFVETLPRLRNEYAHGTQMLHASVLMTFQIVSDLINQLWSRRATGGEASDTP